MGIYDAMNKGILLSNKEWLYFLNAGDIFFSDDVLNKLYDFIIN
ncbi:glycosyltransferase, partial [Escherichia albertii]|nr:glycosyltransferase [Escherichia albertii]